MNKGESPFLFLHDESAYTLGTGAQKNKSEEKKYMLTSAPKCGIIYI